MSDIKLNRDDKEVIDSYKKLGKDEDSEKKISGKSLEEREKKFSPSIRETFQNQKDKIERGITEKKDKLAQNFKEIKNKVKEKVERAKADINQKFKSTFSKLIKFGDSLLENNKKIVNNKTNLFQVDKKIKATDDNDMKEKLELEKEKLEVEKEKLKLECHESHHRYHKKEKRKHKFTKKEEKKLKELEKKSDKSEKEDNEEKKLKEKKKKYEEEEKSEKYHKEKRDETVKNNKKDIGERIDKEKEKRDKLRKEIKDKAGPEKEKDEEKLKELDSHIHHLEKEKKHHEKKEEHYSHENETLLERIKRICLSDSMSGFIFFCALSVFIFTFTGFIALNDSTFMKLNPRTKHYQKFLTYGGLAYFGTFIIILAINFGMDKSLEQKVASFLLLAGSFYMALYFLYLETAGDFTNQGLSKSEERSVQFATAISVLFIFGCIYYDLFSTHIKSKKLSNEISGFLGLGFVLMSVIFFFIMGGIITGLAFHSTYKNDSNLSFLMPLSAILFFLGIFGIVTAILSFLKPIDEVVGDVVESGLNFIETISVKVIVMLCFAMTIYYTYVLYKITKYPESRSDYAEKNKSKYDFIENVVDGSFKAGIALISFFLLTLGMTFGGTMDERVFSTFLVFFVTLVGALLLWLSQQNRIGYSDSSQKHLIEATEIIFVTILVLTVYYVLFMANPVRDETITALSKIVIIAGVVIFFVYVFGLICTSLFWIWPHGSLRDQLWAAFGIGLAVILIAIGLLFFL